MTANELIQYIETNKLEFQMVDNSLIIPDKTETIISFFAEFIPIDKNKTPLDQDVSIIDKDDCM